MRDAEITFQPYIDAGITNEDTNWEDKFWDTIHVSQEEYTGLYPSKNHENTFLYLYLHGVETFI